jgi:hypothetical protein
MDNRIANNYWEYNLKKSEFDKIKNDKDKIMEFIRDKYEYKKWVNNNDIDPMQKIINNININNNNKDEFKFNWNYFNINNNINNNNIK